MITINNHQSVFEIGSISKVFTSTILANQIINGNLKLEDNVNDFFDFPFHDNTKLSLLELANHSSGLPRLPSNLDLDIVDPDNPYKNYGTEELIHYLQNELILKDSLINTYQYSNLGAGLLGNALTKKMNSTYEALLQSTILNKYKMYNTTTIRKNISDQLVKGLNLKGEIISNWDMSALVGAGGILSTTEDLAKFTIAHFDKNNRMLQLTTDKTFEVNSKMSIGLGWHLIKSDSSKNWLWHNGGTGGYSSSLTMNKETKKAVIVLSNVSALSPKMAFIDKLCFELLDTIDK